MACLLDRLIDQRVEILFTVLHTDVILANAISSDG